LLLDEYLMNSLQLKIAIAVPPTNDVDVYAHDIGFITMVNEHGDLVGFNMITGGGMGVTHGNKKTFPSTGRVLGFVTPEQGILASEKILIIQRDNGDRVKSVFSLHALFRH
jgi:sulfite reductase (NADPH) hemoprotein beta-component